MYRYAAALLLTVSLAAGASAQSLPTYTLTYNAAEGSLTIDAFGNDLYTYIVYSPGSFIPPNHTQIPGNPSTVAFTSVDTEISDSNTAAWTDLGPTSLGNVLPTGLTPQQFDDAITSAFYVNQLGELGNPSSFNTFQTTYQVPEPSSIVLLGLGAALLAQRRRRT